MMGERTVMQEALFYSFRIEDHVPNDHLLRAIDRFVDLSGIREHLRPYYSETGRPSIDPELMIRMLIIGYCMGIRSERRLCEEVHLNLAYRWFCRLDLDGAVPDHSTFSKNRHGRFRDSDLLRRLFEMTVERCMAEGLVGGEGFAVDASLIRADKAFTHAALDGHLEQLAQQIAVAEAAVPVLREGRVIGHRTIQIEAAEPAIGEVEMHLFAKPPLRPDAHAIAYQQHPDHQLGGDRGSTGRAVKRLQVLADAVQIDEPVNRAQQVIARHVILDAEAVKQRLLHHSPLAHHQHISRFAKITESAA